ncbi:DUF3800 domain-containing protein [Staphylococcus saprophyticus]|uniref:DUF3800 domain-containing protein n=1 Tax=Staphylococcus saprophyticus TaxID=29385 RepID=UPI0034C60926
MNKESIREMERPKIIDIDRQEFYYYDETNNSRVFRLKNDSFNVDPLQKFSLGGLVSKVDIIDDKHEELWSKLKLDKSLKDLKAKHILKKSSDFLECIDSDKVTSLLKYTKDKGYLLHFSYMNLLYFTLVDIVDNVYNVNSDMDARYLKEELYLKMKDNIEWSKNLFKKYEYPSIENQDDLNDFYNEIAEYLQKQNNKNLCTEILIEMFTEPKTLNFFDAEKPNQFISDFAFAYARIPNIFTKSYHNFDEELFIKEILDKHDNSKIKWYESHKHRTIQLCDCLISIISRFISYIDENDYETLKCQLARVAVDSDFDANAKIVHKNLLLIGKLLDESAKHEPLNTNLITVQSTLDDYRKFVKKFSHLYKLYFS